MQAPKVPRSVATRAAVVRGAATPQTNRPLRPLQYDRSLKLVALSFFAQDKEAVLADVRSIISTQLGTDLEKVVPADVPRAP